MLLSFEAASKRYRRHAREIVAVDRLTFDLDVGESLCVLGSARSGKTTLLRLAAGVEIPDAGTVSFVGRATSAMSRRERENLFRHEIGCVWQAAGPDHVEVVQFVSWPVLSAGKSVRAGAELAREKLSLVEADDFMDARIGDLSPSERMRVCLAQALVRSPRLLIADEPSKTLDPIDRRRIVDLLRSVTGEAGIALLMTAGDATGALPHAQLGSLDRGQLRISQPPVADVLPFQPRAAHG